MKRIITALLMVFAIVGYVGLPSLQAATTNTSDTVSIETNFFGEDEAHNGASALLNQDRDMSRQIRIGDGERWSPYPPYYRSEF